MKKILLLLLIPILLTGCVKKDNIKKEVIKEEKVVKEEVSKEEDKYVDLNNTPIGIYKLKNNTLYKLTEDTYNVKSLEDIGIFQIYPSSDNEVIVNDGFANSFYNAWTNYNQNNNLKIGFNIKFKTNDGNTISYNILSPENTFDEWEYLLNYLYDDYANRGKGFYSHIENNEYNENTLFTAIKLQSNDKIYDIDGKIELTVFTYDGLDDFVDNEYRGNSKYTYIININK